MSISSANSCVQQATGPDHRVVNFFQSIDTGGSGREDQEHGAPRCSSVPNCFLHGIQDLSASKDRSGFLDSKELQRALAMGNLQYGITDVDQASFTEERNISMQEDLLAIVD